MAPEQTPGSLVLLIRLTRLVYRRATEEVLGIRLKQYMALNHLAQTPDVGQRQFGEAMHLDPNNTVLMLNDLEGAGWAERRRDPDDRRRHVVEITPAGRKALARAEQALDGLEEDVLDGLSPEERATLRDLLLRAMADVPAAA
ncbi:MAG TPA: MarR family winged helix-turn-helix transcriptional regulator [Solirubrobacteraceae bacterium]|nr:MarR family winged helix-turn-helix transcriptional regulator [Solirubrobacteraceae bacterium]